MTKKSPPVHFTRFPPSLFFQIIHDRISPAVSSDGRVWNSDPGALHLRREYSDVGQDFPFQGILERPRETAVPCILLLLTDPTECRSAHEFSFKQRLFRLIWLLNS